MTNHKNSQFSNSFAFGTIDPIFLKLGSFGSEWSAIQADEFSWKSLTSGNIFWFLCYLAKNDTEMSSVQPTQINKKTANVVIDS